MKDQSIMKNASIFIFLLSAFFVKAQERTSTALANVHVLENEFEMPDLNRKRKVRLYLPPNYTESQKSYPVIYMHDGQNLFDDATSFVGEWGVDEILNEIASEGGPEFIVVGIDNGGSLRTEELTPYANEKYGGGKGTLYMQFIVEVIKPYIDEHFRTKSDVENTAIMGSSLGGLISHFAIYEYPDVFGKAGIYSPSYWFSYDAMARLTEEKPIPSNYRLNLIVGKKEGESMYLPFEQMCSLIEESGHDPGHISYKVVEAGEHNERFWRSEFKESILWLFKDN